MSEPNSLSSSRSAYLRSAMHQPVRWMEWGAAAFAQAAAQDKPILLDIGAVWCHWCHVMDRESYEDAETARLINEHFIAIKVDRDERPDVDARYQAAVAAISGQGGWPLTAFLTPDGKPFFGGTYFPPVDGHGRPGLRRVLMTMAEAFEHRRDEVQDSGESVLAAIEQNESFDGSGSQPGAALVTAIAASALGQFDPRFGGFGAQPKFPNSSALDLLIDEAGRAGQPGALSGAARTAVLLTLEKMSKGGIYDHLAGGFHRYSVDEQWVVPHFEKMLYDNAGLLRNFVHAYQTFREPECARVARETMRWIDDCLSDRERGGFYSSQDADAAGGSLADDGDYFTWTRDEAAALLTAEELAVAGTFFDIGEMGDMQHNPLKNTLHIEQPLSVVAAQAGVAAGRAAELVQSARAKLYAGRRLRPAPAIDRTVYTGWNAMMVSAYLAAGRVLGDGAAIGFALRTLDRLLAGGAEELGHVVAYDDGMAPSEVLAGGLEDYVFTATAALDAWEATGEYRYFQASATLADVLITRFYDQERGGFFDTAQPGPGTLGALSTRRKPLQDSPTPAGNPVAAALLLRLAELTRRPDLRAKAAATLACFAGVVEHLGLYVSTYALSLRSMVLPAEQVVVVGDDARAGALEAAALEGFAIHKTVIRLKSVDVDLPPALAETLPHLPPQTESFAVVCRGFSCGLPIHHPEQLKQSKA